MAASSIAEIPRWRRTTLLLVWLLVIGIAYGSYWLEHWIKASPGFDWSWDRVPQWLQLGLLLSTVVKYLACFLVAVLGGAYIFKLLAWPYRHPILLAMYSTFPDDHPPTVGLWPLGALPRRILEWMFYYRGVLSLATTRRFLYVALHPWVYPVRTKDGRGWRVSLFDIGPERIYEKLQLYIEAELFHPQVTEGPRRETLNQHGERVAGIFSDNVWIYGNGKTPELPCETCFDVFGSNHDRILRYLRAQQQLQRPPLFISKVQFATGFVAPTFLVSGPLNEFDEDWTKLVGAYRDKLTLAHDPLKLVPELRKLQSFTWDCWVQWGPSIPVCDGGSWKGGDVALQFGYGDEDNSLPMRVSSLPAVKDIPEATERCRVVLEGLLRQYESTVSSDLGWAWPVKAEGYLRWMNRDERNAAMCPAQRDYNLTSEDRGWLVFDVESIGHDDHGPLLYSAYVWALFAVCQPRPSGPGFELLHVKNVFTDGTVQDARWRGLLPFFRHGNIAEECVFNDTKRELARQTIDTLMMQIARAHAAGLTTLHFAFVGSFDNYGDGDVTMPVALPPGESIPELLQQEYQERRGRATPTELALLDAIHVDSNSLPDITAADVPEIVGSYLAHVEHLRQAALMRGKE